MADDATTHTILISYNYFFELTMLEAKFNPISSSTNIINGF